ncbi:MAG: zinc-finger domain-containing protein [Rhodospirillaceae bacterium]
MQPIETIIVDKLTVDCDGGVGALGHPRVALSLEKSGQATCPYCSRVYSLGESAGTGSRGH